MNKITMSKENNLTLMEAFEHFTRKCRVKNLSDKTIKTYGQQIVHFYKFYGEDSLVNEISENTIDDYVLWLRDNNNVNDVTINSYLRCIRAFLYHCMEYGYVTPFKIHMIKAEKKIKETYSDNELALLLDKPDVKTCSFTEYKCWVFENYLLGTGNRLSTALSIRIKDIDFENGVIKLSKTKNRKQQIIPLSNALSSVLSEYLEYREGEADDYLFCNVYGSQGSTRSYQQMVERYNHKRGVDKTSCHLFRHTFAKHWILNHGDIVRLMKILGHSDLTVTKEYLNMFSDDLKVDFEEFNPLDNLTKSNKRIRM